MYWTTLQSVFTSWWYVDHANPTISCYFFIVAQKILLFKNVVDSYRTCTKKRHRPGWQVMKSPQFQCTKPWSCAKNCSARTKEDAAMALATMPKKSIATLHNSMLWDPAAATTSLSCLQIVDQCQSSNANTSQWGAWAQVLLLDKGRGRNKISLACRDIASWMKSAQIPWVGWTRGHQGRVTSSRSMWPWHDMW